MIPNGVDGDAIEQAKPFAEPRTVVLSAGRVESYKQVDKTIAAVAHLPENFVLRITGDGSIRPELEELVTRMKMSERVRFLGKVSEEDLYRWFRTTSVYVSMSSNEAMPVTFIECLAAGARVVASDIPAHRDLVAKTRGSIRLVGLDATPGEVATAIVELAAEPVKQAAVDTWDEVTKRTLELYEEAIAEAKPLTHAAR